MNTIVVYKLCIVNLKGLLSKFSLSQLTFAKLKQFVCSIKGQFQVFTDNQKVKKNMICKIVCGN